MRVKDNLRTISAMQSPGWASAEHAAACGGGKAIAADPVLSDREALVEAIYRERYSEEQLARRIEYRSRRDRPLWNHLRRVEDIDAAE
jgi:hypothetical protein